MPNFKTIAEALKALKPESSSLETLDEAMATVALHYDYNHGAVHIGENGKPYHGHAVKNLAEFQEAIQNKDLVYIMPTIDDYIDAYTELSNADAADANLTTTRSGVIAFAGTKDTEWGTDFTYKIRFKSKYINKDYILKIVGQNNVELANLILATYKQTFNTDQFCDVVIYKKDSKELTSDKTVVTFYPTTLAKVEKLIRECNVYDDERNTASLNVKDQFLIIQNPCNKEELEFIVVKPLSITSSNIVRKKGIDNNTKYNSGVFYSPSKSSYITFELDDEITNRLKDTSNNNKTYAKSSRLTSVAKNTFRLAAAKKIFNTEYTGADNFRQRYVDDLISVWVSDLDSGVSFIHREPKIREYIAKKFGVKEDEDYKRYHSILRNIKRNLFNQWSKINHYQE